jgi:hypothetical protein
MLELFLTTLGALLSFVRKNRLATGIVAKGPLAFVIPCSGSAPTLAETVHSIQRLQDSSGELYIAVAAYGRTRKLEKQCQELGIELLQGKTKTEAIRNACDHFIEKECLGITILHPGSVVSSTVPLGLRRAFGKGQGAVQLHLRLEETDQEYDEIQRVSFSCVHHLRALGRSYWGLSGGLWDDGIALRSDIVKLVPYDLHSTAYYWRLLENGVDVGYAPEASVYSLQQEKKSFSLSIWFENSKELLLKIRRGNRRLIEPLLAYATLPLRYLLPLLLVVTLFLLGISGVYYILLVVLHILLGGYQERVNPFAPGNIAALFRSLVKLPGRWWKKVQGKAWIRTSRGVQ